MVFPTQMLYSSCISLQVSQCDWLALGGGLLLVVHIGILGRIAPEGSLGTLHDLDNPRWLLQWILNKRLD